MSTIDRLTQAAKQAMDDVEIERLVPGLSALIGFAVDDDRFAIRISNGQAHLSEPMETPDIIVLASAAAWDKVLETPPPPTFHSFTALELANPAFEITGSGHMLAQCRPFLERLIERIVQVPSADIALVPSDITQITGRYVPVQIDGVTHNLYVEQAGQGVPVLLLHTAGADSRQYQHQLSDIALTQQYAFFAVDLPFHGRSMPPSNWKGEPYLLTAARYLTWCTAILQHIIGEPAVIVGGSMGAAMSLLLAAERADWVRGVIAVEPPFQSKGRRNAYQHHVGVHGALHNASFVRGLMSPMSPEIDRRLASWIYSQAAPGIYSGDLAFYSDEFDGAVIGPKIDTRITPVTLLCGDYDYSATPEDGRKLQSCIPGARWIEMRGLGHFPMCENPNRFRPYLVDALADFV